MFIMKTNEYYTMEQHRDMCYKLNKHRPPNPSVCEGCKLIEEIPIPGMPGYFKKVCHPEKLRSIDNG
jgi:hypothetical protein